MTQREECLELMHKFKTTDFETTPLFVVMRALHTALKNSGSFTGEGASRIVGRMEVKVSDEFVQDKTLFDEVIESYVVALVNIKKTCDSIDHHLFWELVESGKTLYLKYS